MKRSNVRWNKSVRKLRGVGQGYGESLFYLILDIERQLRKMNRIDSQAFREMLRTISRVANPKQANAQRLSRYLE
jgi:hypothetical protein